MRELKFRVWDKKNKIMWYDTDYMIDFKGDLFLKCVNTEPTIYATFQKNKNILMQFTGLKDKNGVRIYEGDIILTAPFKKDMGYVYEVAYTTLGARFDGMSLLSGIGEHLSVLSNNCEVIGNIYQNKELLKGGK